MRRGSIFAFVALGLLAGSARADILPDGHKSVKLSIRVDAEVPAGKALILGHTFRVIDVVKPGAVAAVEWHPLAGQMVLMTVPAASITDKVEEHRKNQVSEPLKEIEKAGTPCHKGFDGVRTVPVDSPADEVRWNFKVTFAGDTCTATLTGMEFFDSSGKPVEGKGVPVPPGVSTAASAASAAPSSSGSAPAAPGAAQGGCGCEIGAGAPLDRTGALGGGAAGAGLLSALGLFLSTRRRRR